MKFNSKQYAQALYEALQETKDHDKVVDNFVKILAQNGDLSKHPEIEREFKLIEMKAKGITETNITFAQEHNPKILDDLNSIVSGKMEMKTKIDSNMLGGVIVKVDDTLIDGSLKTQLEKLNSELKL